MCLCLPTHANRLRQILESHLHGTSTLAEGSALLALLFILASVLTVACSFSSPPCSFSSCPCVPQEWA